jgi:predicted nucleic acid-binding protein
MIIDTSVALKWFITEADSDLADRLLPRSDLRAPAVLQIEFGYVLTKRVRQRTLTRDQAQDIWRDLPESIALIDDSPLLGAAFELSLALGAAFYDCVYLAQAVRDEDMVITADERFIQAVQSRPSLGRYVQSLAETVS